MNAIDTQIVTCYEDLGMTIDQIATDTGYEPASIKTILLQNSTQYRHSSKTTPGEDISDAEFEQIKHTIKHLALHSDDDYLRARLCKFLWDEKKERNGVEKNHLKTINISVNLINQQLKKLKGAIDV